MLLITYTVSRLLNFFILLHYLHNRFFLTRPFLLLCQTQRLMIEKHGMLTIGFTFDSFPFFKNDIFLVALGSFNLNWIYFTHNNS